MKKLPIVAVAAFFACAASSFASEYKIDTGHSSVGFKIKHLAISTVRGNFSKFDGTIDVDPTKLNTLKVDATIDAKSIDTKEPKRDKHLMGEDFFSAEKNPSITFKSKKAEFTGNKGKVSGDLTMHGITQPVTLDVEFLGTAKDPWGNNKASFSATTTVKRKDYKMTWNQNLDNGGLLIGEDVDIMLDIEANLVEKKVEKKPTKSPNFFTKLPRKLSEALGHSSKRSSASFIFVPYAFSSTASMFFQSVYCPRYFFKLEVAHAIT